MGAARKIAFLIMAALFICSCNSRKAVTDSDGINGNLVIFHAGSLAMPFKAIADSFMRINPGVKVLNEASGSIDAARKITELNRECDIMASADYAIIDNILIPKYASENIRFAANEMALVYTSKSRYSGEIDTTNWIDILAKDGVFTGRSDPDADPCGYRTILTLKLAEIYYGQAGRHDLIALTEKILARSARFIRPKEVDLLALLETGAVDYIFLYKSVAVQHNLEFLRLPAAINLGDPQMSEYYSQATTEVRGAKPDQKIKIKGEPMVYGVTILNSAPNRRAAEAFIEFLRSDEGGKKILMQMGQSAL